MLTKDEVRMFVQQSQGPLFEGNVVAKFGAFFAAVCAQAGFTYVETYMLCEELIGRDAIGDEMREACLNEDMERIMELTELDVPSVSVLGTRASDRSAQVVTHWHPLEVKVRIDKKGAASVDCVVEAQHSDGGAFWEFGFGAGEVDRIQKQLLLTAAEMHCVKNQVFDAVWRYLCDEGGRDA